MLTEAAAEAIFRDYAAAWRSNRAGRIAAAWDPDRFLFYKAEEVGVFFRRWEQVRDYWRHNEGLHERVVLRFSECRVLPLEGPQALVLTRMRWDIRFASDATLPDGSAFAHCGRAMGGDNHVLALLGACDQEPSRRHDEVPKRWKFRGWSETPDAPITYIRELYLAQADEAALGGGPESYPES